MRISKLSWMLAIGLSVMGGLALPSANAVTIVGGNTLVDRPDNDGAVGSVFLMQDLMPASGNLTQWSYFDNDGAGRQITPLLIERVGTNSFAIRGIGTTQASSGSGVQAHAFGLVSGTNAVTNENFYFGWKDGSNGANNAGVPDGTFAGNPDEFGVSWFGTKTTFAVGDNLGGSSFFNREYSLQFTVDNAVLPAQPAEISAINLTGALDISKRGKLVEAFNLGGGPTLNIAGIDFVASPVTLGGSFTGANPTNATSDANLNSLLNTETFGTGSLIIDDLVVGKDYEVQLLFTDNRTCCSGRTVTIVSGGTTFTSAAIGIPQSLFVNFTAGSSTQTIFFNGSASLGYLGGFQVRDVTVPEPASIGMIAIAGLALMQRRRRFN